jgi:hypothetical protein
MDLLVGFFLDVILCYYCFSCHIVAEVVDLGPLAISICFLKPAATKTFFIVTCGVRTYVLTPLKNLTVAE